NTYTGKPLLEDREIRVFLMNIFLEIAQEKGFQIVECEMLSDHVHLLIEQNYMVSTSLVMKNLKGISSRRLFQKYNTNRYEIRKLWGRSFNARKINQDQTENVVNYIRNQRSSEGIDKRF
ncbi:MAG: IS200/IS605 family transposase, partial [Candidatus Saganbacteria bacterium]|nr:IS200/IS605 family transposase [Candidatus Saganbacteria bacterium]